VYDKRFFNPQKPILVAQPDNTTNSPVAGNTELELSALIRFFRNPAQFFFNRSLKVDLNLNLQADDNDEPFNLDGLGRYKLQASLIDSALSQANHDVDIELLTELKASGSLPMAPFDDILLSQYQRDIAPLINRVHFLQDEQPSGSVNIDLTIKAHLTQPGHERQANMTSIDENAINLVGRIDDVSPKGMINYRPGTAHGRDLIQCYIRHLCLNAQGIMKYSYLLDMGHFHCFAPVNADHALEKLSQFVQSFIHGQQHPLCFAPRTAWMYAQTEGTHNEKLFAAQKQWRDEQTHLGEGFEPHHQRLFTFPDDFSEPTFGALVQTLLQPMVSLYHKGKLSELDDFVSDGAVSLHATEIAKAMD